MTWTTWKITIFTDFCNSVQASLFLLREHIYFTSAFVKCISSLLICALDGKCCRTLRGSSKIQLGVKECVEQEKKKLEKGEKKSVSEKRNKNGKRSRRKTSCRKD